MNIGKDCTRQRNKYNSDTAPQLSDDLQTIDVSDDEDYLATSGEAHGNQIEERKLEIQESAKYTDDDENGCSRTTGMHTASFGSEASTTVNDNTQNGSHTSDLNKTPDPESPITFKDDTPDSILAQTKTAGYCGSSQTPAVAAGLPSHHPRANSASAWLRFHQHHHTPSVVCKTIMQQKHKRPVS